ncbi:MAG: hypothetical protein ACI8XC_000278 [Gammaproteobacteria bacterium]|jgi:hypothetical protein
MNLSPSIFYNNQQKYLNLWWQATLLLSVFLAINILLYLLDHRLLADEELWIKPLKFEISIIIHFITLSTLAALLSPARHNSNTWKGMTYLVVAAGLFEVLYIFLQAARGRESHYNNATTVESAIYGLMGLGALALVAGSFYLGYLLYREYQSERNSALLLSSALGLTIGSILTLIVASYLSSLPTGYVIEAGTQVDVLRLPIFSWYLNGQDLRIPHFFATHMMQLFPLYGLWLSRQDMSIVDCKKRLFWSTGLYSLVVTLLFIVALL